MLPIFSKEGLPTKRDYVFIGQAPNKIGNNIPIFLGSSGAATKLSNLLCISQKELFTNLAWAINIFKQWPGYANKGDLFPIKQARENAYSISNYINGCYIIMLGKNVAKAFDIKKIEFFEWFKFNGGEAVVIPHPSGVNRWWNDKKNKKQAIIFFNCLRNKIINKK